MQQKRSKQLAEYFQKPDENKAIKSERSTRPIPKKNGLCTRDSYKADPEKKKTSVRDSYKADIESKRSAKM